MTDNQVLDRIFMITERMIVFDGLDDVFEHIVKTAVALTHAEAATIRIFDMKTGNIEIVKGFGLTEGFISQPPIRIGDGITGKVIQTGKPFHSPEVTKENECRNSELADLEGIRSIICVPMKSKDSSIGCITVYRKTNDAFEDHEMLILSIFAAEAVQAVEKGRLLSELHQQATLDTLTGLHNKRAFMDKLNAELDRRRRNNQALSLMFLDLDDFKSYNDTHGHLMGDKLIHDFTRILTRHCRKIDILGRFGGDEFVICAPQTDMKGAKVLSEKLLQETQNHHFLTSKPDLQHQTTCSIGIAVCQPNEDTTVEDLLDRADKALYASKKNGRNQASIWSNETSTLRALRENAC